MTDPLVNALDAIAAKQLALCLDYEAAGLRPDPEAPRAALVATYATLEDCAATLRALLPPSRPAPVVAFLPPSSRAPVPVRRAVVKASTAWWATAPRAGFTDTATRRHS